MNYRPVSTARASVAAWFCIALTGCTEPPAESATPPPDVEHVEVYFEKGRFGGWPANHGIWNWGDEILVGFTKGYYKDMGERHHMDREKPEIHMLARSLDGGETWSIEDPGAEGYLLTEGGFLNGVTRPGVEIPELQDSPGGINFTHPDFALTVRTNDINSGVGRFHYSYDRGKTWEGPYRLPKFGAPGIAPRTDYIVNGQDECMLFITAAKEDGEEGRPLCVGTTDAGKTWDFVSWIGPEPEGFSIMPASVRLSEQEILVTVRRREGPKRFIEAYLSTDNGATFEYLNEPVPDAGVGNPPAMIRLADGRVCLTYGYRAEPFSIRAVLSSDGGRTWGEDIVLRDDGSSPDIGYPRVVQRPDGKVVALYYYSPKGPAPERRIAATIWAVPGA
jgi:BNR repeat protein